VETEGFEPSELVRTAGAGPPWGPDVQSLVCLMGTSLTARRLTISQ